MIIKFWGESDDLIYVSIDGDVEEYYNNQFELVSNNDKMIVRVDYIDPGVWAVGIAPFDEDEDMPNWPVSYCLGGRGYSTELTIDVPEDTALNVCNN